MSYDTLPRGSRGPQKVLNANVQPLIRTRLHHHRSAHFGRYGAPGQGADEVKLGQIFAAWDLWGFSDRKPPCKAVQF